MSLFEKVAWFNSVSLGIGAIFYAVTLQSMVATLNFEISLIVLVSSTILLILCNFAWIIFADNEGGPSRRNSGSGDETIPGFRSDLHSIYWGALSALLIGTWFWLTYAIGGVLSEKVNVIIAILGLGLFFLFTASFLLYKKRKGESVVAGDEYTSAEILFQKGLPGHDERDLLIRKSSRRHSLAILFTILAAVFLMGMFFRARSDPGEFAFPLRIAYLPLLFAAAMSFRHIIIQISTIIQYRLGR